jgi:hypothetical protein
LHYNLLDPRRKPLEGKLRQGLAWPGTDEKAGGRFFYRGEDPGTPMNWPASAHAQKGGLAQIWHKSKNQERGSEEICASNVLESLDLKGLDRW